MNLNKVILSGRLTRDPDTRTAGGSTVASFSLAIRRTFKKRDGANGEETCFVDVEAWGKTGETIARYMTKGREIFIEGRLRLEIWDNNGNRRSKHSIVCENFQFMDGGNAPAAATAPPRTTDAAPKASRPFRAKSASSRGAWRGATDDNPLG